MLVKLNSVSIYAVFVSKSKFLKPELKNRLYFYRAEYLAFDDEGDDAMFPLAWSTVTVERIVTKENKKRTFLKLRDV